MATTDVQQQEWSSGEMANQEHEHQDHQSSDVETKQPSSLLPALPVDGGNPEQNIDSELNGIETRVEDLGIFTPPSAASAGNNYPSPPSMDGEHINPAKDSQSAVNAKTRGSHLPAPLQIHPLESKIGHPSSRSASSSASFVNSPINTCESPLSTAPVHPFQHPQPWMNNNGTSPRHGPLLTPSNSSPALTPHPSSYGGSANSLPLPGMLTPSSRKNSVASLGGTPRVSPGFRGAPLGQTSDTESVLKQFDVYFGKVYLTGQLQKKNELGIEGYKLQGEQWAAYNVELIGPKLLLTPVAGSGGLGAVAEEMNMEEARVEMQDGPNGGTFTINWMGANKSIFQPVQQVSLGPPEVGSNCQDWVCAIRLSCYECSRLQEIYTSTLLRRPKFRDQVAATIEGPIKAEGMLRVKFWAGDEWQRLWVVVSDQRGEEVKKKKQGKVLQAAPVRGQIHFFENPRSKRPFISMYNVSQAYAVCPSRSTLNASKDNKVDEEGSLTIKLEGDVVLQRDSLSPPRKGFFSSPTPPSVLARDLQALLPTGRSMFAMFQVPNAMERTKFLLGTSEAFRIYGKPGPLLFDSPTDPAAMNFGCMASSLLQQELLIGLDAVLHLPQKSESLADVKFSFGEVLRKRLLAENPPTHQRRLSSHMGRRQSSIPYGMSGIPEGMGPPSPMLTMAMRSRANSTTGFLVPQPSPGLHPAHMAPWAASPHSPQLGPYGGANSPRQGPLHASPYSQHLHRPTYAASSTSTDENDANLATDDEGEDDEYPDTPEEEDDDLHTPFRSRSGSLMAPAPPGYAQVRKGSVGALSMQNGRSGRSGSFTSAYGVQMVAPDSSKKTVLELPSLHSFSNDFGIQSGDSKEKQQKLTAVVYPTQIVIPKNKKRKDSTPGETGGLKSAVSLNSPSPPVVGGAPSSPVQISSQGAPVELSVSESK
ncbi:hypothetical protein BG011_009227 [Mortierella polycephala]|uniref:Skg3/CAF120-like PH-like domain-containing protein n=1 Tax=Mortierella polycephala TaxID=41804 RepID=A0A9P6TWG4_9FUNG|nr:hypothetical protein BG011_009227 [Mortierella polycephala]